MKRHKRIKILDEVKTPQGWEFVVSVNGETYKVSLWRKNYQTLSQGVKPAKLVEAAFRFLLEREKPEQILNEFELGQIQIYFPDFKKRIKDYL